MAQATGEKFRLKRVETGRYRYTYKGKDGSRIKGLLVLVPVEEGAALTLQQEKRAARRQLVALADRIIEASVKWR